MEILGSIAALVFIIGIVLTVISLFRAVNRKKHLKQFSIVTAVSFIVLCISVSMDNKPVKSDKELFSDYYSQLISNTNIADAAFVPFKEQLEKGDIVGATQIALNIKTTMNSKWSDISSMSLPKLQSKDVNEKLIKAHESISNAYMYRSSAVTEFISFTESQNIKKMAELKNTAEAAQMHTVNGMSNLFEVATAVGYSFNNK